MNTMNTMNTYPVKNSADVPEVGAGFRKLPIARTDGKKGKTDLCIVVPEVSDAVMSVVYNNEHGRQWIAAQIDAMRSKIASEINKAGRAITSDLVGVTAILTAMQSDLQSSRFCKETVIAWFDAELMPLLQSAIRSKLVGISDDKLMRLAEGYRNDLVTLTGRNAIVSNELRLKITKALQLLPDDYCHPIAEKLAEKLRAASNSCVEDVL